ncbi:hypothetical protein PCANC_27154, partial [Puccinia coronata f. sp. avenae]
GKRENSLLQELARIVADLLGLKSHVKTQEGLFKPDFFLAPTCISDFTQGSIAPSF